MIEIDPSAHAGNDLAPFAGVTQNDAAAFFVEHVDAELFDVAFAADLEFLFHFEFDWQAVAIPAESTFDVVAAHSVVTWNDVFNGAGKKMAVMR